MGVQTSSNRSLEVVVLWGQIADEEWREQGERELGGWGGGRWIK